jgi:hypothetical protein
MVTAPQDLVAMAMRHGMGKVPQEQLAEFAREVLAGQAAEVERLRGVLADVLRVVEACGHADMCPRGSDDDEEEDADCECSKAELLAILSPDGSKFLARYRALTVETERIRLRLETAHQEARDNLERAEKAEVRLKQVQEDGAALGVGFALLARKIRQFSHAEACEVDDTYDADELEGCQCALLLLPAVHAVLTADHPSTVIAEQHAKELVRGRNEGLAKAAAWARELSRLGTTELHPDSVADCIAAMKEAEQ